MQARFLPALGLKHERAARERLIQLAQAAKQARRGPPRPWSGSTSPSIAVLPFLNIGAEPDNEYLCEGLAEELINALSKIKSFFVVARASAFAFRGTGIEVREIGRRLNVDTLLQGSIQRSGDRLRIAAQLIDAKSGHQFWSERFDRQMTDVFAHPG